MPDVPADNSLHTPPAPANILQLVPELAGKSRTAVRLHPRRVNEDPARDENKLGGQFLWPAEEPWPVCREHDMPYAAILQLRKESVPELGFPEGSDLFQLLWCPEQHDDPWVWVKPKIFWRNSAEIADPMPRTPVLPNEEEAVVQKKMNAPWSAFVPLPCSITPERVSDLPQSWDPAFPTQSLCKGEESIEERLGRGVWALPGASPQLDEYSEKLNGTELYEAIRYQGIDYYCWTLSSCPGTKVGGYVSWCNIAHEPTCACGRKMEHWISIAGFENNSGSFRRWLPEEDSTRWDDLSEKDQAEINWPHGMTFGDHGDIYVYICRHCPDWPIATECQCC